MNLTRTAETFYDSILTLVYPQICAICGRSVEQRRFGVACETCWRETRIFTDDEEICWKCGVLGPACGRCESLAFTAARAIGIYEGALRESVLLLKRQPYVPQEVGRSSGGGGEARAGEFQHASRSRAAASPAVKDERFQSGVDHWTGGVESPPVAAR